MCPLILSEADDRFLSAATSGGFSADSAAQPGGTPQAEVPPQSEPRPRLALARADGCSWPASSVGGDDGDADRCAEVRELTGEQRALAARNLGLVGVHLKRNVPRSGPPTRSRERDDLFQEGCLALVRAARTYDPVEHGGSFAAYALPRIRSAVHWALHEYFPTIRVPVRVNRAKGERGGCGFADRPPVAEELSYEIARDLPARSPVCEGEVTIWHAVRERYRRAVRLAVAEVQAGVRRGKNAAKIVEAVAEERLLISRPERQTSLRAMARRLGTHKSRVMAHENRLRSSVRRHFAADPQLPVLIRLARRDPEGFAGRLDREKRRELRRAEVQCFAGQFADLSRSAKADLVYRMIEQTVPAVTEMACNLYRLTNSPEPLSVDRVA